MKIFKPQSNHVIKSFYLWKNVFGVVIKQIFFFKWFRICYVYLLYMCKLLKIIQSQVSFVSFEQIMRKKMHSKFDI
jgi:hypothetical protein